ncbi:ABC-2 type transport system permease protein [Ruaniaceae bacterium KH17]|nr:ABC-2 type transport system permease protein [Ruaniaceae bacterium KH17]
MPIFANELRHGWKSLLWWALGLVLVTLMYVPFYESIGASPEMASLLESLPQALIVGMGFDSMLSGAGYVHSSILELTAAIVVLIAGMAWGARAIAGDEEEGMLELTLAHGVSRGRVYAERALAIAVKLAALGLVLGLTLAASNGPFGLELDLGFLTAGVVSFTLLAAALAYVALAVGAATGRRGMAVGVGSVVAVAAYMANVFARQSEDFDWLADISPFGWAFAEIPIMNGWDWPGIGLLAALAAVAFAVGLVTLNRRDLHD